jgi:hypothetical protein
MDRSTQEKNKEPAMPAFWRRRPCIFATLAIGLIFCGAVAGEEVWVKRVSLPIREGKGAAFATVATAVKGQKLHVIERDGKWLKVQLDEKQGYVYEDSISPREVRAGGDELRAALGGSDTSPLAADAAAKGLQPEAEVYAKSKNLNPASLEQMIARRKALTGEQWMTFVSEGKVGPAR